MPDVIQQLLAEAPVITDGAWGTQLHALGLASGSCPDEWNLTYPDLVERVAAGYVAAGSRVILTNTFRSNRIALEGFGLADQAAVINTSGVLISRKAAGSKAKVFASMGPTGKILMMGEISEEEVTATFAEQAAALAAGHADAIVVETMSDLSEATIAVRAAKSTGLPVIASMVFDSGKNNDRTMMGSTPEDVARELADAGADVIGANCGLGMEGYIGIGTRLRAATHLPIWIKPNAGLPELVDGRIIYRTSAEEFARQALVLRDAGVHFIGGCCGTSPEFISALATALGR